MVSIYCPSYCPSHRVRWTIRNESFIEFCVDCPSHPPVHLPPPYLSMNDHKGILIIRMCFPSVRRLLHVGQLRLWRSGRHSDLEIASPFSISSNESSVLLLDAIIQ